MCYADDALPPIAPGGGDITDARDLVLEGADGNRFKGYIAHPAAPSATGVVILPDVRGLHEFYKELARQFAAAGHHSIAFDYFGRSAGLGERGDDFDYKTYVPELSREGVDSDCQAAVAYLRSHDGGAVNTIASVGFCMGGGHSWRQSARDAGIDGCVGFYGVPDRVRDVIADMRKPLLLLVAGADMTPIGEFKRFDRELTAAGVTHRMVVYEGAPHSYFDRHFGEWKKACADSWVQMLEFIGELSDPPARR